MGALAVKTLVERIEGEEGKPPAKEISLKPELIVRKTCGFHLTSYRLNGLGQQVDPFSLDHLSH
jgi:hypothetical protein